MMIDHRYRKGVTAGLTAFACSLAPSLAAAAVPLVQVGRGQAPVIDGKLTDPAWRTCAQLMPFIKMDAAGLAAAQSRALVFYDDAALYVAFRCDEPAMSKLVAKNKTRDGALWHDDCVEVFLRRPGVSGFYQIVVNALGVTYEARAHEASWNPSLRASVFKQSDGWSVEIALPWSDLGGAPTPGQAWRANFCRERKVATELSSWSAAYGQFLAIRTFGEIRFADRPVRLETFDLKPQLPGANAARLKLALPEGAAATVHVSGAEPVQVDPGSDKPVALTYPLGLTDDAVVFEARVDRQPVWRTAIPARIAPHPQLARLERPLGAMRKSLESLPRDSSLRTSVQAAVTRAERVAGDLRKAIQVSLAKNRPLDGKQYRRLNTAVLVEANELNRMRWPIWTKNNWLNVEQTELPETLGDVAHVDLTSLVNEYESANVIVSNVSAEPLHLRVTASDLTWFRESAKSAKSLIANGDFEQDADKDGVPDGWRHVTGSRKAWRIEQDPACGKVMAIDCGQTKTLTVRQNLELELGKEYCLAFRAKSQHATPCVRVGVINKGWTRSQFSRPIAGTSGWHRINTRITVRPSQTHQLVVWVSPGGGGTVWLDDVRLIEGGDPSVTFEGTAPELSVADWQELRVGSVVADPLVPLNQAGRLDVSPGQCRQIWLTMPARDLPPGTYECMVQLTQLATVADQGSAVSKSVRVQLDVEPLRLRTSPQFAVYNWDYARDEAYVRDLYEHKVNFYLISTGLPWPSFGPAGNALGPMDFSAYDQMLRIKMRYARKAGGQILFSYGIIRSFHYKVSKAYGWKFMDARWVRGFRHVYTSWLNHLKALGLGYDEFCVQVWDEATGENVSYVVEGGKLLREIDPHVRLVMDGAQSIEEVRRMEPVIDVWVPHLNKLLIPRVGPRLLACYRKTGKPIYTYTCATNMKSQSAYTYHRLKPWHAARLGLDGVFYWDYNSWRGDPWNDFDGPIADCGAIYDGADGPITSRRWEASREGIEDWQIMRLVRRLAEEPGADKPAAGRAAKLIDEALKAVLNKKDQPDLANRYRVKMIKAGADLARRDPLKITGASGQAKNGKVIVTCKTSRPASAKLLYRVIGENAWRTVGPTMGREHDLRAPLPPLSDAEWIAIAWDDVGRVAVKQSEKAAAKN